MKKLILSLLSLAFGMTNAYANERVVSLGGGVTEIIYALKQEKKLVGVDNSSIYPAEADKLPKVGYYRQIPVEGIVALQPSLVLSSDLAGPKKSLDDLKQLGIPLKMLPDQATIDVLYQRVQMIADALDASSEGNDLVNKIKKDIAEAQSLPSQPLKTLFILNRTGTMMAAGSDNAANEIMRLSGVENIFTQQKGFKPVSAESLVNAQPELIIVTEFSTKAPDSLNQLKALPALADSPAVKNHRILVLEDVLALTLGPRTAEAIQKIKAATLPAK